MKSLQHLVLLLLTCAYQGAANTCPDKQYQKDGRCCGLCQPGKKLFSECTEQADTVCMDCDEGEFQNNWTKETHCNQHSYCDPNAGFEQVKEGSTTMNVQCRCRSGRHCSSDPCETCVLNSACEPGYGVSQEAETHSDTVCSPCINGTFSSANTELCKKWSRCNPDEIEVKPGTRVSDVVCEPGPTRRSRTAIYVAVPIVISLAVVVAVILGFLWRQWAKAKNGKQKETEQQNDLENGNLIANVPIETNIPEEYYDPELVETTIQGLPVAQEEGKDYHMPQEEM